MTKKSKKENSIIGIIKECFREKLGSGSGESLTETLVSVLIMSLVIAVLSGSVEVSAKINKQASEIVTASDMSAEESEKTDMAVTIYKAKSKPDDNGIYSAEASAHGERAEVSLYTEEHKRESSEKTDNFYYYEIK